MKEELLHIILKSHEPVYELDLYISKLNTNQEKEIAWKELKEIALFGNINQRFISLTVISVNNLSDLEEFSYKLINVTKITQIDKLLKPIISICSKIGKEEHLKFMIKVLEYAENNSKEYLYDITLRFIISTKHWRPVLKNIIKVLQYYDEITMIDFLAFFIYKNGVNEYKKFLTHLPNKILEKVQFLYSKIYNRYMENYHS